MEGKDTEPGGVLGIDSKESQKIPWNLRMKKGCHSGGKEEKQRISLATLRRGLEWALSSAAKISSKH